MGIKASEVYFSNHFFPLYYLYLKILYKIFICENLINLNLAIYD